MNDFLDDNEVKALIVFNSSSMMKQAVKKVLLAGLYQNGVLTKGKDAQPRKNAAFWGVSNLPEASNEALGADLRALWQGLNAVEMAWEKIKDYLPEERSKAKTNPAK